MLTKGRSNTLHAAGANTHASQPMPDVVDGRFVCSVMDCHKSYKRRAEWSRHALAHTATRRFTCLAQGCRMTFTRKDKLVDHMRAGHDVNELFTCPKTTCGAHLTRDVLPLHVQDFSYISKHRKCPMPRCKFGIADTRSRSLNNLQSHLLNEHDTRGRMKFADVLALRGYHYEHVEIICPLCPESTLFENHGTFYQHFIVGHRPGLTAPSEKFLRTLDAGQGYGNGTAQQALRECKVYPEEVSVHRYTILSLWPEFEDHPVWDDIKHCSA
jgi:hypothetical protein